VQIFTSGEQGAIILSMSRSWIRLGDPPRDTLQLTAKWFDFKTKTEVDITTSATWTVYPATATLVAGLFSSTIAGACTATVQYQGHSKTVRLYVVPQLAPGDTDDDQDGLPDSWERLYSLNPGDQTDWMSDIDNDGLTAMDEYLAGSDPRVGNKDLDGTISADGTISNADRLVWSDANTAASGPSVPLGWVGATRQCVVLWKDLFEVWDACLMVPPDYTYPDFDSSVNYPVSYYSGDRLYFSKQVDCIMDPRALAADIDITFYPDDAYEISCWRGIGRMDTSVDPPERVTGRLLPEANPSSVRDPGAPLNTTLVRNLATWKHFEPYVDPFYTWQYASTPPIFFHFTYSLYRVEFGQVDPPSYSMNNVRIVGFVGDSPPSGTRSLDITGRLLFSPAIPDNYPPPNQGDKTTIKCRWRFKGQAEWTDWTLDDITLGEVCDDPPPGPRGFLWMS